MRYSKLLLCTLLFAFPIVEGQMSAGHGQFTHPESVTLDGAGNIFIADAGRNMIQKINVNNGMVGPVAGDGVPCPVATDPCGDGGPTLAANLRVPSGAALDSDGNIYIADTHDNRIRVVNMEPTVITVAGVTIQPGDIQTVAGTGVLCGGGLCGDGSRALDALLNSPFSVAVDADGNIDIADTGDNRIRQVNTTGIIQTIAR